MDTKVKISCIVPAYNVENYVEKCIGSLLCQNFDDYEIIIVNDGSTDSTLKRISKFENDNKIRIISQDNGGLSAARNTGIKYACGEYITFVDSDDWVEGHFLTYMYELAQKENADIVTLDYIQTNEEKIEISIEKSYATKTISQKCADELFCGKVTNFAWGKLIRRNLISDDFFPVGRRYEDIGSMYRVFDKCNKLVESSAKLYFYRIREGSITDGRCCRDVDDKLYFLSQMKRYELSYEYEYWDFYRLIKCFGVVSDLYKIKKLASSERKKYLKKIYIIADELTMPKDTLKMGMDGIRVVLIKAHIANLFFNIKLCINK